MSNPLEEAFILPEENIQSSEIFADKDATINALMAINKKHQQQNGDLMKDNLFYKKKAEHYQIMSDQLKKELEELKKRTTGLLTEFRNKGDV